MDSKKPQKKQLGSMRNWKVKSALNILRVEGVRSLVTETLRFLSLYYTPDKVIKSWLHRLAGTEWVMRNIQGSWMLLNLKEGGINWDLYLNGIREPRATKYLQSILQKDWWVVDIGANVGYYALQEGRRCETVSAIEPDPHNFAQLKLNLALNPGLNVCATNVAIGDKDGEIRFDTSHPSNWRRVSETGDIKVLVEKLDSFFGSRPDFLRMDTEGYELKILEGAKEVMRKWKPGMFIEVHNFMMDARKFYELLAQFDYSIIKSFVMAPNREGPTGKVTDILKDEKAYKVLVNGSIASHIFIK